MKKQLLNNIFKHFASLADPVKKRADYLVSPDDGERNRIIGYFLSDNINVFIFNIDHGTVPDHGLKQRNDGRYLRVNCCRKGGCEFTKNGEIYRLSAGETLMDYNDGNDGEFAFTADEYVGVEVIMQVDKVLEDHPVLAALKRSVKSMSLPDHAMVIDSFYYVSQSEQTSRVLDEIIEYSEEKEDAEVIVVKVAELAYAVGKDLEKEKKSKTHYVSGSQKRIAEEIHEKLTYEFGEKWTVRLFADKYGLSETTIKNYFKNAFGCGFKEYQMKIRMENAALMLEKSKLSVGEISELCGYYSQAKFGAAFKKYFKSTPLEYRRLARIQSAETGK